MDEAGIMEGLGVNGLVVGASELRKAFIKEPKRGCWMTFVECISASGASLDPLVIYNGKSIQQQWFPDKLLPKLRNWSFTVSENGWTSNSHTLEWLTKVFIPRTKPQDPQQRRLLILDGHGSHVQDQFMFECFKHHVHLLYLPAHTSHILQPLDLAIFSPLKASYRKWAHKLFIQTDTSAMGKSGFISCLYEARVEALTGYNIKADWRAAGLWPLNPRKPLRSNQLLPQQNQASHSTSSKANAQASEQADQEADGFATQANQQFRPPEKSVDIDVLIRRPEKNPLSPSSELVLSKIKKGYDKRIFDLAHQKTVCEELEAKIEQLRPQKKASVRPNPNEKFVNIEQIMEVKAKLEKEAEARKKSSEDWQRNHSPDRTMHQLRFKDMCFEWQLG